LGLKAISEDKTGQQYKIQRTIYSWQRSFDSTKLNLPTFKQ
jgi:hypothetical protein